MKKLCYFGIYSRDYSRYRVLKRGLEENGVEIVECHSSKRGIDRFFELLKRHQEIQKNYDVLLVGYPGHRVVVLAKFLSLLSRKPLIFDAFISVYDTRILDRGYDKPGSLRSIYYWLQDWLACQLADIVLLDTYAHIDYFVKTFRISPKKFRRILVGSDDSVIHPKEYQRTNGGFLVHFHGTFIPLQGIQYIIRAAKLLEHTDIHFNIVGKGQTYSSIINLTRVLDVKNVTFIEPVPYHRLREFMCLSDVCLGIFGDTEKTKRVIPNKVYEALAVRRPCLTSDTPSIRELFTNRVNILLCNLADPKDLANKIIELKNSPDLRDVIANNGYNLFTCRLRPKSITQELAREIREL